MNVGLSTSVIQRGRSGVGRYVLALVRALLANPACPRLTLFVLEADRPLFAFAEGRARLVVVPERHRPPLRDIVWHQTVLPRLARQFGLDLLHVPSYRRMLARASCPLVTTIHDLAAFHLEGKYDRARMFYGRVVARWLARRQDRIIAISRTTAADLQRYFHLPAGRITVVANGLDHAQFRPGDPAAARRWAAGRLGRDQPFFLYIARLEHPAKNHVRLIEAFERLKAATRLDWLLVLGGGDWHGAEVIHRRIARSPCAADILRLGFVPESEIPDWYRAAGVFVFPSLFEGFGLPPLEAMASGCPVVCSERGALGEVTGGAAVTVDPEDVDGWQRQMAGLALEEDRRRAVREAGIARAQDFSWERSAAATLAVYARVLERRAHRAGAAIPDLLGADGR